MKKILTYLFLILPFLAVAQNRNEMAVLGGTRNLQNAIFKNRDSATIENLFAGEVSYGHSGGKIENRQEAIRNILKNTSTYSGVEMGPVYLQVNGETAITRHELTATEHTADGRNVSLKLHIVMVWTKEKKGWKMMARQAVKVNG